MVSRLGQAAIDRRLRTHSGAPVGVPGDRVAVPQGDVVNTKNRDRVSAALTVCAAIVIALFVAGVIKP